MHQPERPLTKKPPTATTTGTAEADEHKTFDTMGLPMPLLRGIYAHGFEKPSVIQQQAIAPMLRGDDILGQAPSGTGKTGAFSIGLLGRMTQQLSKIPALQHRRLHTQVVVLSPTRELAQQNYDVIAALSRFLLPDDDEMRAEGPSRDDDDDADNNINRAKNATTVSGSKGISACELFVGGTDRGRDAAMLRRKTVLVAVGTVGRMADLMRRGLLRVDGLQTIVLDEADEMLSQGFAEQIREVFRYVPRDVQVALFSATLSAEVMELTSKLLRPEATTRILVDTADLSLKGIAQYHVKLEEDEKLLAITDLYEKISVSQSVIFCNSRRKATWLAEQLRAEHHAVSLLHAEMGKEERSSVMDAFRHGAARVLVATDLVARGIDVQRVSIVVNFDVPLCLETYLHRIGRSGRYGRRGMAITLVTPLDAANLREIEQHYGRVVEELPADFEGIVYESSA